ncbi:hypothetical protein G6F40_015728 [Rhizopus arrhizus]|nr:hypothetical protein G6F40_015728 [Rhizopus arrhizus]
MRSWSTTSLSCQTWARILLDPALQVGIAVEGHAIGAQADARSDHAGAGTIVQARGQDRHPHAALAVVVRALQQGGGLAGVHRRIVEVELGHRRIVRRSPGPPKPFSNPTGGRLWSSPGPATIRSPCTVSIPPKPPPSCTWMGRCWCSPARAAARPA